ncbi:MAG: flagellar biosynthesis protein FlhF [Candidatus Delongbacteria bacterium]|nr:flagellar biosynthesis protein FlhF [Candidatus Delongbacteria bacterium]
MRIKKFQAKDIKEALSMVKKELGAQAVILKSETIKSRGHWGNESVEITAAVDMTQQDHDILRQTAQESKRPLDFQTQLSSTETESPAADRIDLPAEPEYITFSFHGDDKIKYFQKILYKNEMTPFHLIKLTKQVLENYQPTMDMPEIAGLFRESLRRSIRISGQLLLRKNKPTIMALIGPTGVGKTTTIAKLAANFSIYGKLKIGLITIDTYRIAAVDQLRTFAEIINLPLKVVYNEQGMLEALDEFLGMNLILIDTAGRSPKNEDQIHELQDLLQVAQPEETHLVLSATTKLNDNLDVISRFGIIPIHRLIFTKLDETESFGMIFNILQTIPKPVSYFTTGQSVPEDIELANEDYLVNRILGELNVDSGQ